MYIISKISRPKMAHEVLVVSYDVIFNVAMNIIIWGQYTVMFALPLVEFQFHVGSLQNYIYIAKLL